MTAPLPPLPKFPTRLRMCINRDYLTEPEFLIAEIRSYCRAYSLQAVREALERATDAMHHAGVNTWEDAVLILRAIAEEYKND